MLQAWQLQHEEFCSSILSVTVVTRCAYAGVATCVCINLSSVPVRHQVTSIIWDRHRHWHRHRCAAGRCGRAAGIRRTATGTLGRRGRGITSGNLAIVIADRGRAAMPADANTDPDGSSNDAADGDDGSDDYYLQEERVRGRVKAKYSGRLEAWCSFTLAHGN